MAVTSTNNLRLGSKGDDVLDLQKRLNQTSYGYNLAEDGSFGEKTLAAVKDYQQRSGLAVDGIVGTNTWGALTKAQSEAAGNATATAPTETKAPAFSYEAYKPSDTVTQAEALLQQQLAQKPGAYQSTWQGQLDDIINRIMNREDFSYNLNEDAMYQQLKDQYMLLGQQASMDTMGKAAALTGGYGNSYAQQVGQQTYQGYLQQLNDRVPELYGMALDKYNQEGQNLIDQYGILGAQEEQNYGRYRDNLSDYYAELGRLTDDARYQGEQDYGRWADKLNLDYGMHRDQIADQQWQAQFDEAKRQYDQQYELQNKSKTTSSNPGRDPGTTYTAPDGWRRADIIAFQEKYGLKVDGVWGPESEAKYKEVFGDKGYTPGQVIPFNGTTYSEAVAYAKANGVPSGYASSIYDKQTFSRKKASSSNSDAKSFDTYEEYLQYAVESMIDAYAKK